MSRQNPFMRSTGDRFCNNCQNGYRNNCSDPHSCCDDGDDCHDKDNDKNPCVICPPGVCASCDHADRLTFPAGR